MAKERRINDYETFSVPPSGDPNALRIVIPRLGPASQKELANRRQIFAEVDVIRERMLPVSVEELLAEDEDESVIRSDD